MTPRIYTLAEAQATLPAVRQAISVLRRNRRRVQQVRLLIEAVQRSAGSDGTSYRTDTRSLEHESHTLIEEMRTHVRQLQALGVQVKDFARGLVDWTAEREGRQVYLCWQDGEAEIAYWHEVADGVAGRRPIVPEDWA